MAMGIFLVVLVVYGFYWIIDRSSNAGGAVGGILALIIILIVLAAMGFS